MSLVKKHDYHILEPSSHPLLASIFVLMMAIGFVFWMNGQHDFDFLKNPYLFSIGLVGLLVTVIAWWADVTREAEHEGHHTPVVQLHHRYGVFLFIASEVMFFVAWFWAFFDASLFPYEIQSIIGNGDLKDIALGDVRQAVKLEATGGIWPPVNTEVFDAWKLPFLNTLILLLSGCTLTYGHHALLHKDRKGFITGLSLTIILGIFFSALQAVEYMHAPFAFKESIYGATFYLATGFHGFHVIVGVVFLAVCLGRGLNNHFTEKHHFGFEAAAWYWHFVDIVWLFLFVTVYIWGNFGGVIH